MSQLLLKGVYYDEETAGLWFLNNSGSYEKISTGGGLPYKNYVAIFTSDGADMPLLYEKENTIATVNWVTDSTGTYIGTFQNSLFAESQVWVGGFNPNFANGLIVMPITDYASIIGYALYSTNFNSGTMEVWLEILNSSFVHTKFVDIMGGVNGNLLCLPEIRIYPS